MVSVLAVNAVDRGFVPRPVQTKDYNIAICCFKAKHAVVRKKTNTGWFGIRKMCPNVADCCFSELAL